MIKKTILEFAVKDSKLALEFYENLFKGQIEVLRKVPISSPGISHNLHRSFINKEHAIIDSLIKINHDYFKIYEWDVNNDGKYDDNLIRPFNLHLQFDSQKNAQELWNKLAESEGSKIIQKFDKKEVGEIWFYWGVIQDPFKIKWTFTYYPNNDDDMT